MDDLKDKFVLEKLLCYYLNLSKTDLWLKYEYVLTDKMEKSILVAYKKSVDQKIPLEYILWFVEFFWVKFFVDENTLIPRPETEYMILAVNEFITNNLLSEKKYCLIDVGTGCGVLGISVLLQKLDVLEEIIFSDISKGALDVAKKNYIKLLGEKKGLDVKFLKTDLLENTGFNNFLDAWKNVIFVANLPYIPDEMFEENSPDNVKKHEPRFAFVWWKDGLDLYRRMFGQLKWYWSSYVMFLEMMTWQVDILRKEFDWLAFEEVKTFHFNIRIVKCWITLKT